MQTCSNSASHSELEAWQQTQHARRLTWRLRTASASCPARTCPGRRPSSRCSTPWAHSGQLLYTRDGEGARRAYLLQSLSVLAISAKSSPATMRSRKPFSRASASSFDRVMGSCASQRAPMSAGTTGFRRGSSARGSCGSPPSTTLDDASPCACTGCGTRAPAPGKSWLARPRNVNDGHVSDGEQHGCARRGRRSRPLLAIRKAGSRPWLRSRTRGSTHQLQLVSPIGFPVARGGGAPG